MPTLTSLVFDQRRRCRTALCILRPSWDFIAPEFSSWMYPILLPCYRRGFTRVGGTAQTVFQTIDWTLSFLVNKMPRAKTVRFMMVYGMHYFTPSTSSSGGLLETRLPCNIHTTSAAAATQLLCKDSDAHPSWWLTSLGQ